MDTEAKKEQKIQQLQRTVLLMRSELPKEVQVKLHLRVVGLLVTETLAREWGWEPEKEAAEILEKKRIPAFEKTIKNELEHAQRMSNVGDESDAEKYPHYGVQ